MKLPHLSLNKKDNSMEEYQVKESMERSILLRTNTNQHHKRSDRLALCSSTDSEEEFRADLCNY